MEVELFGVGDTGRMREALALRIAVFVDEQGVPLADEVDAHDRDDSSAVHALARDAAGVVVVGRFYDAGSGTAQIGRMVVRADARGAGWGRTLLDVLLGEARRRGFRRAVLHAQAHAVGFYERAGFGNAGAPFEECGIPHQPMAAPLWARVRRAPR